MLDILISAQNLALYSAATTHVILRLMGATWVPQCAIPLCTCMKQPQMMATSWSPFLCALKISIWSRRRWDGLKESRYNIKTNYSTSHNGKECTEHFRLMIHNTAMLSGLGEKTNTSAVAIYISSMFDSLFFKESTCSAPLWLFNISWQYIVV